MSSLGTFMASFLSQFVLYGLFHIIAFLKHLYFFIVIAVQDLRDIDQCEEVEELEDTQSEAPMDQD